MVRAVKAMREGEGEEKRRRQEGCRAAEHTPRNGDSSPGQSRAHHYQDRRRNPGALAEDHKPPKVKPFCAGPGQLEEIAVEDFTPHHARRVQQINRSVVPLIDWDEWKDKC